MHSGHQFLAVSAFLCLAGCTAAPPAVHQFGAMREVMRDGQSEPRIDITEAVKRPHAVGVGALQGLTGEITILDGRVWVARIDDEDIRVTGPEPMDDDKATLLTLSYVREWQSVILDESIESTALESLIERVALKQGIDVLRPFPFVFDGTMDRLDLHVINGYCPIATDPATVDAQPWRLENRQFVEAVIVGFYAPNAGGILTHHGTSIHAHAIVQIDGRTITGHVDQVAVAAGTTLRLPRTE